ncbi:MAG: tripartite tricarboxylate transporter TctB family protein [Betaproteobacteria bacterium]|nr:tripartite tricarboxylate transporter TctB family protein [Betaproteobacteria bacterium]MDH5344104.1 tripartite tricarboxylate transporter TctB family protein [Betaproteobacteria bacterium]
MRLNRWLGPCIVVLALVWLWLTYAYIPAARVPEEPGPRAFPVVLGFSLLAVGIAISFAAWLRSSNKPSPELVKAVTARETAIVTGTFLLLIFYTFFMEKLGFMIATSVSILIVMRVLLGMRQWRFMLTFAISVTAVCWLFFVKLLETPLPRGLWLM